MKTNSLSPSDLADQQVAQAERYAQDALRLLSQNRPELGTEALKEAHEKIHLHFQTRFLFPHLLGWQHSLLMALYWEKQALTRLVNVAHQTLSPPLQTQAERVTNSVERSFMSLVCQIKDLVGYGSLSPAQRVLFDREYVRIVFLDTPE